MSHCRENGVSERRNGACSNTDREERQDQALHSAFLSESLEKWSESPFFSTVWEFSRNSRISKFSRTSRTWTFPKRPLFQKTPFSQSEVFFLFLVFFRDLGKLYAYSPYKSLLILHLLLLPVSLLEPTMPLHLQGVPTSNLDICTREHTFVLFRLT